MPRLKLTEVELDNAWLDELAQLEPITREEVEAAKQAVKESEHDDSDSEEAGS